MTIADDLSCAWSFRLSRHRVSPRIAAPDSQRSLVFHRLPGIVNRPRVRCAALQGGAPGEVGLRHLVAARSAAAAFTSGVSNPSVNQTYTSASASTASFLPP
jgi:hypothetical protein